LSAKDQQIPNTYVSSQILHSSNEILDTGFQARFCEKQGLFRAKFIKNKGFFRNFLTKIRAGIQ
jgi:hypothetical protein